MSSKRSHALLAIRMITDISLVALAWVVSYFLRFYSGLPVPKGVPEWSLYFKLIPFITVIWLAVFTAAGFYRRTGSHRSAFLEGLDIVQSCIFASISFIAFTYFYEEYRYSRAALVFFFVIHPWMIITGRSLIRKFLRLYRKKSSPRKLLIIGSGLTIRHAFELEHSREYEAAEVEGCILVGNDAQVEEARKLCHENNFKIFSVPESWPDFFAAHPIQSIIFILPHGSYGFLDEHLEVIADQVTDINMIPDLMRYTRFAAGIDLIDGIPVLSIHESPLEGLGSLTKRFIDLIGAVVALIVFSPIMLLVAILVPLSSPGPIFYRQERMGLDGKSFEILKFRTMPIDAESQTGAVWARKEDNRATALGSFLRRSSLDELPQLFNVVVGDMSLVGPRPERPVFVNDFRKKVPGYMLRHKVKAGITGWAQVNGWRGNTSIEKRIECDLFYIQNWSVWFDIRILFLTIFRGFINKNAY